MKAFQRKQTITDLEVNAAPIGDSGENKAGTPFTDFATEVMGTLVTTVKIAEADNPENIPLSEHALLTGTILTGSAHEETTVKPNWVFNVPNMKPVQEVKK